MIVTVSGAEDGTDPSGTDDVVAAELTFLSYAEFGQRFFEVAVTKERVAQAVARLAGTPIEFGPLSVVPLGLVKVRAKGAVGQPSVEPRESEHVSFLLTIPVDLQILIEMGLDKYRFTAAVQVRLTLTARAAEPLKIVIDVQPPTKRTVDVQVQAEGLRASVLQIFAGVDGELKKSVAKYVRREIDKPEMQAARVIDVARALASMKLPR